jgi:hypothetical protein
MSYTIESCKRGFYWIGYSGTVTMDLRLKALRDVETASTHVPIRGNIIDFRGSNLLCSFTEQFEFAAKATGQPGHRGRKAAYLVNDMHDASVEILELAMSNRGIDTKLFTDELQAIKWLTDDCFQSCKGFAAGRCALTNINELRFSQSISKPQG